ncbi:MAG: thioredoxin family protein [Cytophagales bacterium]|nr:thioredoxin family protein [Cytophagales bacterium]
MKRTLFYVLLLLTGALNLQAQIQNPSHWSFSTEPQTAKAGEEVKLIFTAKIEPKWYLYSSDFDPELGPMVTTFKFDLNDTYELIGKVVPVNPKKKYDDLWGGEYTYFKKEGKFIQKVKVLKDNPKIKGIVEGQVCSDENGQCIPFEKDFVFSLNAKGKNPAQSQTTPSVAKTDDGIPVKVYSRSAKEEKLLEPEKSKQSLLLFFIAAFLAGLTALFTPCVFPMIPMTVTFFSSQSKSRSEAISKALVFGLSIIVLYTVSGTLVASFLGPEFNNWLSTSWIPNVLFFAIFLIFALSFLGLFEITLPSSIVNKVDKEADKGGYYGALFMGFTIVLVSFSCTGPIVGSLLVESAQGGIKLKPIIGMLGFGAAFAIPFTLFAIFPEWLNNLPKSGGWLNSVKVTLGFVELALGFKFLSVADQAYHWGLLDRDVYLAIWIAIFAILGLYFLGKIMLPHDSKTEKLSVFRVLMATITFTFVIYLIPGLWGAPLKALSGYLPPMATHDFDLLGAIKYKNNTAQETEIKGCEEAKYADFLHLPYGIQGYFDLDQAIECSKAQNKPIFLDFTGHGCVNCREMEARVWSDPEVLKILKNEYVVLALYVDDKTELPQNQWYRSSYDNKIKKTIGKQNADYQIGKYKNNAQPYYCLLNSDGELMVKPKAYDLNASNFVKFLKKGIKEYKENL